MLAVQPSAVVEIDGAVLPVDWVKVTPPAPIVAEYLTESAKYASSAVTRLRRSDFIEARYAFSFVLANFGIAIAKFANTKEKAYLASMKSDLRNLVTAEEAYFADSVKYTNNLGTNRSEARRVGKESRSRWSQYHYETEKHTTTTKTCAIYVE